MTPDRSALELVDRIYGTDDVANVPFGDFVDLAAAAASDPDRLEATPMDMTRILRLICWSLTKSVLILVSTSTASLHMTICRGPVTAGLPWSALLRRPG